MHKPKLAKPDIRDTAALLAYSKQLYGDATMTGPDQPPAPPAPPAPADPPKNDPPEKMLPQSEVNRIAAKEKDEGKAAALKEVQDALGVDLETAKSILADHKKRADSEKSEAQREADSAKASREAADAEKAEAVKERHEARVDRAFVAAGLTDEAKISRYSRLLEVEVGAKPEDIKAAVEKLKKDEPALFTAKTDDPKRPPAPGSDPKGGPPKPKTDETAFDRGMERAKAMSTGTPSYASLIESGT